MIGVLVPARNEAKRIAKCLASIRRASQHPGLEGEPVCVVVAADHCDDDTASIARASGAQVVEVPHPGGVGRARAAAADFAIASGARWLASTDADSEVPDTWLVTQLACGGDVFCGLVTVSDWEDYSAPVACQFDALHMPSVDHTHVHGANLGICSHAYLTCGGFTSLLTGEDRQLVRRCQELGMKIVRSGAGRVITSARRHGRAPAGFAAYLQSLESTMAAMHGLPPDVAPSH